MRSKIPIGQVVTMVVLIVGLAFGLWQVKQSQDIKKSEAGYTGRYCGMCTQKEACECSFGKQTGRKCLQAPSECRSLINTWQPDSSCTVNTACGGVGSKPTPTPISYPKRKVPYCDYDLYYIVVLNDSPFQYQNCHLGIPKNWLVCTGPDGHARCGDPLPSSTPTPVSRPTPTPTSRPTSTPTPVSRPTPTPTPVSRPTPTPTPTPPAGYTCNGVCFANGYYCSVRGSGTCAPGKFCCYRE